MRNGNVRGWDGGGVQATAAVTLAEKLLLSDNDNSIAAGLSVGNGSMVRDCVASGNHIGFYCGDRTHITNCIATLNHIGFSCTSYISIVDCTSSRNVAYGISAGGACTISRCTASRTSVGDGINAGAGSTVTDCTSTLNEYHGIVADQGSTISNCTSNSNLGRGIHVGDKCHVTGNTCNANYRGVSVSGNGSRVDSNSCTGNTLEGYYITGATNLIIRNSAHGNATNYSVAATNTSGPIVGSSGVITTTNPWTNFSY